MKLKSFRVKDFRSVNDSGPIEVRDRTALVGRNESGKTNLLLALASLKPPGGMTEMTFVKDFPRDRMRDEFSEDTRPVETTWELTDQEQQELAEIFPRAKNVREVTIGRYYHARVAGPQGARTGSGRGLSPTACTARIPRSHGRPAGAPSERQSASPVVSAHRPHLLARRIAEGQRREQRVR